MPLFGQNAITETPPMAKMNITVQSGSEIKAVVIDAEGVEEVLPGMTDDERVRQVVDTLKALVILDQVLQRLYGPNAVAWTDQHVTEAN